MKNLKILIIEDQKKVSKVIKLVAEETFEDLFDNVDTVLAEDGREALNAINTSKFDLILSDLNMPHLGGNELINKIHEMAAGIPIVVISAYPEELDKGVEELVYIMEKPFDIDRLSKVIRISLGDKLKSQAS
jgi:two-component system, OmpR family, response regulator